MSKFYSIILTLVGVGMTGAALAFETTNSAMMMIFFILSLVCYIFVLTQVEEKDAPVVSALLCLNALYPAFMSLGTFGYIIVLFPIGFMLLIDIQMLINTYYDNL
jgi:hypothetical protein